MSIYPRCARVHNIIYKIANLIRFIRRRILISLVLNWNKSQPSSSNQAGGFYILDLEAFS